MMPVLVRGFALLVSERMFFTARFSQDAEFAERTYVFFSAERAEKKRSYSVMAVMIIAGYIIT